MQKTLLSYWKYKPFYKKDVCKKTAKYPRVIADLIYSFLPTTQELWIEQRLRYMATAKFSEADADWNWPDSYDISLLGYPANHDDYRSTNGYEIRIGYDLDSAALALRRNIRTITPRRFWKNRGADS